MEERRFKEQAYALVARIARAADSPRRLEMLEVLAQGPRTVESLARETALSVAKISRHLQVLARPARQGRRQGLFVEYRLADLGVRSVAVIWRTPSAGSATWTASCGATSAPGTTSSRWAEKSFSHACVRDP
jgi:DNA-binding transcriptional ArsR family regulator